MAFWAPSSYVKGFDITGIYPKAILRIPNRSESDLDTHLHENFCTLRFLLEVRGLEIFCAFR